MRHPNDCARYNAFGANRNHVAAGRPQGLNELRKDSGRRGKSQPSAKARAMCRPFGTRLMNLVYPALPCRATGCSVPTGLEAFDFNKPFNLSIRAGSRGLCTALNCCGKIRVEVEGTN